MKNILILMLLLSVCSCKESYSINQELSEIQKWELEWRMVKSAMENNFELGEQQIGMMPIKMYKELILIKTL